MRATCRIARTRQVSSRRVGTTPNRLRTRPRPLDGSQRFGNPSDGNHPSRGNLKLAWVHYEPSDKSFSVSMPGAPLERPIAPTLQGGMTVSGDAFSSGERGTLAFVVTPFTTTRREH